MLQDTDSSVDSGNNTSRIEVKPGFWEDKKGDKMKHGHSSDEDDDESDEMLADLADIDDDNDDIDEFSDGDDDEDDLESSESDCDLRKSLDEAKVKDEDEKKVKLPLSGAKRKKEVSEEVKKGPDDKISESDSEAEPSVANIKRQKVEGVKLSNLPQPVPSTSGNGKSGGGHVYPRASNVWSNSSQRWSRDSGQGAVMTELANLVGAAGTHGGQFRNRFGSSRDMFDHDHVSEDGNDNVEREVASASPEHSSHASNKSDKNLGDFGDEESTDEEMVRLSMLHQHQHLASMAQLYQSRLQGSAHHQRRHHGHRYVWGV